METPFSKGTVNNIIDDWKARINGTDIEDIRGFIAQVRKSGMTLQECAQAFRIVNILKKCKCMMNLMSGWKMKSR
ncbi:MAG: hypothetical protein AB7U98_07860 [Candidatus Nitrosocosmicus sp.]